ncbi:hypothetical protein XELAEV_18036308mg [Xenopus laevis]|uniref:Immunoglobulin V-set domain-containing protein n=1 Tax=Xenopus laevis TaxID=8355 RepID=A0A974CIJ2_XENLA|nr:hypothetical protein XELAEV_18036308mg [Xenopus laevis]
MEIFSHIGFKIEAPAEVTVQRGLCVLIPCNFTVGPGYNLTKDAIGIWYKGYNGYPNGPVAASTDSSQFPDTTNGRFIFTGKVSAGDCSFSISDAQPGDTDQYQFRLVDRDNLRFTFLNIQPTVFVTDPKETCLDSKVIPAMVAGNIFILALMGLGGFWYLKRTRKMSEKGANSRRICAIRGRRINLRNARENSPKKFAGVRKFFSRKTDAGVKNGRRRRKNGRRRQKRAPASKTRRRRRFANFSPFREFRTKFANFSAKRNGANSPITIQNSCSVYHDKIKLTCDQEKYCLVQYKITFPA